MRTIGLLGGMSWESTREYYRILNEAAREAKGGLHSAPIILHSFDFAPIAEKQAAGDWQALQAQLAEAARGLERAGAETILICTNYMHICANAVQAAVNIPLLHIAEVIGQAALAKGHIRLGLLGAAGTMEAPFYREKLEAMGIEVITPNAEERAEVSRIIFEELCRGEFTDSSRNTYLSVMDRLAANGAEGVILGCTEIEQLILPKHTRLPLYASAQIHALAAAQFMLSTENNTEKAA